MAYIVMAYTVMAYIVMAQLVRKRISAIWFPAVWGSELSFVFLFHPSIFLFYPSILAPRLQSCRTRSKREKKKEKRSCDQNLILAPLTDVWRTCMPAFRMGVCNEMGFLCAGMVVGHGIVECG